MLYFILFSYFYFSILFLVLFCWAQDPNIRPMGPFCLLSPFSKAPKWGLNRLAIRPTPQTREACSQRWPNDLACIVKLLFPHSPYARPFASWSLCTVRQQPWLTCIASNKWLPASSNSSNVPTGTPNSTLSRLQAVTSPPGQLLHLAAALSSACGLPHAGKFVHASYSAQHQTVILSQLAHKLSWSSTRLSYPCLAAPLARP